MRTIDGAKASFIAGLVSLVHGETPLRPMSLFSDHMVMQREIAVPVWGTAEPGDTVTVEFAGQRQSAKVDAAGCWQVKLAPLEASADPRPMHIRAHGSGQMVVANDVLVGEVWICSGQSNMEMPVGNPYRPDVYPGVTDFRREIARASHPQIRMFLVEHQLAEQPEREVPTPGWKVCTPETVPRFSAVGYFFARHLQEELKLPVGMISSAVSGTCAEAWCPAAGLRTMPKFARLLEKQRARLDKAVPTVLFNGMIAPLAPYAMRGVIWYQGENNAKAARDYRELFPALISSWRDQWSLPEPIRAGAPGGDFPFLFVQLAGYGRKQRQPVEHNGWADLREAQAMALRLPHTGMAVTIDIGDERRIHPPDKQEVGRRLGLLARVVAYRETLEASGPLYRAMRVEGDKIHVGFDHPGGGLLSQGGGPLTGFAIAGKDLKWQYAEAKVAGVDEVVVSSPLIPRPVAVRYAWAGHPVGNLFSKAGLPAAPFRSDPQ